MEQVKKEVILTMDNTQDPAEMPPGGGGMPSGVPTGDTSGGGFPPVPGPTSTVGDVPGGTVPTPGSAPEVPPVAEVPPVTPTPGSTEGTTVPPTAGVETPVEQSPNPTGEGTGGVGGGTPTM